MELVSTLIAIIPILLILAVIIYVFRGASERVDMVKLLLGASVCTILLGFLVIPVIGGLGDLQPEPEPEPEPLQLVITVDTSIEISAGDSYTFTPTANTSGVSYTLTGSGITISGLTITSDIPGIYNLNLHASKSGYSDSNTAITVTVVSIGSTFTIPAAVTDTDFTPYAFDYCYNVMSIDVETGNTAFSSIDGCLYSADGSILYKVPEGYSGTSFTLPAAVTDTDFTPYAFDRCANITSILVETGNTAYSSIDGCLYSADGSILYKVPEGYSGTSFTLPASVDYDVNIAQMFNGCANITSILVETGNTAYSSIDGCLYSADGTSLYRVPEGYSGTSFTIPATANYGTITDAFYGCSNITSILVETGNTAFASVNGYIYSLDGNDLLKVPEGYSGILTITTTIDGLHDTSLTGSGITSILVETGNTAYSSIDGCLYSADGSILYKVPEGYSGTSFTLPAAVTDAEYTFDRCANITSILVETGNTAFSSIDGCLYSADGSILYKVPEGYSGTSFTLPAAVTDTYFTPYAFDRCANITSILVETGNTAYSSIDGCLYSADGTILYKVPGGY